MVTPTTGTMSFQGKRQTYKVGIYISDVVGAKVLFAAQGAPGTGSDNFFQPPEDVVLTDVQILTGPTVAVGLYLTAGGAPIAGSNILISGALTTNPSRATPQIGFSAKTLVGAVQI